MHRVARLAALVGLARRRLDVRRGRQNQIYFARRPAKEREAEVNRLVYASPDGHVCECCRPSIAVADRRIALMFRNWIDGNRDMDVPRPGGGS